MEKTITFIILIGLLIFVIGILGYLFVNYVKENIVLIRSLNWRTFGEIVLGSLRLIVFFITGLSMMVWSIKEMLQTSGTDWRKTKAKLSRVTLSERTINSEPE